jgi:hypothetical protein
MNSPSGSSFDGSDGGWSGKHGAHFMLRNYSPKRTASGVFIGFQKLWLYLFNNGP